MGSKFIKSPGVHPTSGMNLEARSFGAFNYAAKGAGSAAAKDLGAAAAFGKNMKMGPVAKTAATDAPGPKKV
jgi:hypothetical protein